MRVVLLIFALIFTSNLSFSQNCPSFKVKVIDTQKGMERSGSIEVSVSSGSFDENNFALRQKHNNVNGPLNFEYEIVVSGNKIVFKNLPKSDQLILKYYVIYFSDKSCENGERIEVGQFQIK